MASQMTSLEYKQQEQEQEQERLRLGLIDERGARRAADDSLWDAVDALRVELRRLAAQQDADRLLRSRATVCDAGTQTDATPQPRQDAGTQADPAPQPHPAGIMDLERGLLKGVLHHLSCTELFRARRVCRTWRAAVDDIVAECRSANAGRLDAGSEPNSDLHLRLLVEKKDNVMTQLRAPSEQGETELRIVASSCRHLVKANLRGFIFSSELLKNLAHNSASSLQVVTMPTGITEEQLEALLEPLVALKKLSVSAPRAGGSRWLQALPQTLVELDITGPGVTLPPWTWKSAADGLSLTIEEVTDRELNHLRVIASRVTRLAVYDCPGVTAGAVKSLLTSLTHLTWVLLGRGVDGAVTEAALDGLRGCSQLETLQLENPGQPVTVPAAAVGRLAVSCRKLLVVALNSPLDTCREVLNTLLATQHDIKNSAGQPRGITLGVPETAFNEMTKPPSGSNVKLWWIV